jgi:hypothetical protein
LLAAPAFASQPSFSFDGLPIFSDFDGDHKLDQAELFSNGAVKSIHVSLGNFVWTSLSFDSGVQDRGRLLSADIDSDGDSDLVWIAPGHPGTFVTWLGDGRGNFAVGTARVQEHLRGLLAMAGRAGLAPDSDEGDLICVVQSGPVLILEPAPVLCHFIKSERRTCSIQPCGAPASCVSVVRKRGPPAVSSGIHL